MTAAEDSIMRMERVFQDMLRMHLLETIPAHRDPKSLVPHGYQIYSQNDEDGILAEIFQRIGTTNQHFVEFGVGNGMENNTTALLIQGWKGAWIEGNIQRYNQIQGIFQGFLAQKQLTTGQAFITAENIESFLETLNVPAEFDLLSIDIDHNDYWVWKAIQKFSPRVVVIEFNASFGPSIDWKIKYDATATPQGTRNFGASLKAMELLAREKGMSLVGCSLTGVNAFFVREELLGDKFLAPFTSEQHYKAPRYLMRFPAGHARSPREMEHFR